MNVQISRFTSVGYIKSMISLSLWHFFLSIRQLVSTLVGDARFSPSGYRSIYFFFSLSFLEIRGRMCIGVRTRIGVGPWTFHSKRYNGQGKIVGVWVTGFYRGSKSYFTSTTADHRPSLCISMDLRNAIRDEYRPSNGIVDIQLFTKIFVRW